MPITITDPPVDGPLGIGISLTASSDAAPLPEGSWQMNAALLDPNNRRIIGYGHVQGLHTPFTDITVGELRTPSGSAVWQAYPQWPSTPNSSSVLLRVELQHPVDGVVEFKEQSVKYDTLTGLQWALPKLTQSTVTGGYTDADRQVATQTLTAARAVFPAGISGVADVILDIGQMFTNPPVEILRRDTLLILTGRGTLRYPPGNQEVAAYGAYIELVTTPPGAGRYDGVVLEFERRIAQFAVHGRHGNTQTYVKELHDLKYGGQYLKWGGPFPRSIDYDIAPGTTIGWRWLVLGVQT